MSKAISTFLLACMCCIAFSACQNDYEMPPFNCESVSEHFIFNEKTIPLKLVYSNLFRLETDSGNYKYLGMESISDSFKIVLNIHHGPYTSEQLASDSIPLGDYSYSTNRPTNTGSIAVGIKSQNGYQFLNIDTASIILSRINIKRQVVSGTFYFRTKDAITSTGTFNDACYLSLK